MRSRAAFTKLSLLSLLLIVAVPAAAQPLSISTPPNWNVLMEKLKIQLTATGGTGTGYTWSVISGTLPPGMALRSAPLPVSFPANVTGGLLGIPTTTPGPYAFTVQVRDSGNYTATQAMTITVYDVRQTTDWQLPYAYLGEAYDHTITAAAETAGSITFAEGATGTLLSSLGLSINSSGRITGTPTTAGNWSNVRIAITQNGFTHTRDQWLTIYALRFTTPQLLPPAQKTVFYSTTIAATGGVAPYTYTLSGLPGGLTFDPNTGILSGTPTGNANFLQFDVTVRDSGSLTAVRRFGLPLLSDPRRELSINNPAAPSDLLDVAVGQFGSYQFWVNGGVPPYSFSLTGSPLPNGMYLNANRADVSPSEPYVAGVVHGVPVVPGDYPFTLVVTDSAANTTQRSYTIRVRPIIADTAGSPTMGVPFSQYMVAMGGNPSSYTFSFIKGMFPQGLTLAPSGLISGTATESGNFNFTYQVTDGSAVTYLTSTTMTVGNGQANTVRITTSSPLGRATRNSGYSTNINATGGTGTYNWSQTGGTLPPGLALSGTNPAPSIQITGTPTSPGVYTFTLQAQDPGIPLNIGVRTFSLEVTPLSFTSSGSPPAGNVSTSYSHTFTVTGNTGPVTFTLDSGMLPPGLTLLSGGALTGPPNVVGAFEFTVRATDTTTSRTATQSVRVSIYGVGIDPPLWYDGGDLGQFAMGPVTRELTAQGGRPPYTFSYALGAPQHPNIRVSNRPDVPTSFSASAAAGLLGLVTTPGTFSTTLRLTDSLARYIDRPVTMRFSAVNFQVENTPNTSVGDSYSLQLIGLGGTPPYTFTLNGGSLPPGLTLTSGGLLSGALTTAGSYNFTIHVQDSAATPNFLDRGLSMNVNAMRITNPVNRILPPAVVGQGYSAIITVIGGTTPYSCSITSSPPLPTGFSLTPVPTGCQVSGTGLGTTYGFGFSLRVTDFLGTILDRRMAMSVVPNQPAPLNVGSLSLYDFGFGQYSRSAYGASGGLPPYTYSIASGTPPPGIELVPGAWNQDWNPHQGWLRGIPWQLGTFNFSVRVTDSAANQATVPVTMQVVPLALWNSANIPTSSGPTPVMGTPFSQNLLPLGGTFPYTVTASNRFAPPPAGLTLSSNGLLSGTPNEALWNGPGISDYYWDVRVTDSTPGTPNVATFLPYIRINSNTSVTLTMDGGNFGVLQKGAGYSRQIGVWNSPLIPPSYTVTQVSGTLPPGISLLTGPSDPTVDPNYPAYLAGFPTTPGAYEFIIKAVDSVGNVGQRRILLRVSSLAFFTSAIPRAYVGVGYSAPLDVRGGTGAYTFSLVSGIMPPGLSLNPSTGTISGNPSATMASTLRIRVTDQALDFIERNYGINVYSLQITDNEVLPLATRDQPYSFTFHASPAGSYLWTDSGLPCGLSLNGATGVLSGTPCTTTSSGWVFTVTAGNGATSVSKTFTLFITDADSVNLPSLSARSIPFEATVGQTFSLNLSGLVSGGTPPFTFSLVGSTPPGLNIMPAETYQGTQGYGRYFLAGIPTTPGVYTFTLRATDSLGKSVDRTYTINVATLWVAMSLLKPAFVNQPYSGRLVGVGGTGAYSFALADIPNNPMPTGLTLNATGVVSGIPSFTGYWSFVVRVTSGSSSRYLTVSLLVYSTADLRYIDSGSGRVPDDAAVGLFYRYRIQPTGGNGTHTWTLVSGPGSVPPGITLRSGAGLPPGDSQPDAVLAGIPTTPGSYTFTIKVEDSTLNFGQWTMTLLVTKLFPEPNQPYFLDYIMPPGKVGVPYNHTIPLNNGTPPYTWTWQPRSAVPPGITLSSGGTLGGTPTQAGSFRPYVTVTDSAGFTGRGELDLNFYGATSPIALLAYTGKALQPATLGSLYSFDLNNLVATGYGTAPVTWVFSSGVLPPGLNIVGGTTLSGTPTTLGAYPLPFTFALLGTDAAGTQFLASNISLTVSPLSLAPANMVLPVATLATPYSQTFTAGGGAGPYTHGLAWNSDLPVGLSLSAGGVLSGAPTTAGTFRLIVESKDSATPTPNVISKWYKLAVTSPAPALSVTPSAISLTYTIGSPAPAPIPVQVTSAPTSVAFTTLTSGGAWLSVSPAGGNTTATINLNITPPGVAGPYGGTLTITSAAASNSPLNIPVTLKVVASVPCSYSLSSSSGTLAAAAGSGSFGVTTQSGCSWTASTATGWITINSPGSGTNSGTVGFSATANLSTSSRVGTITVAGLSYTVTQFGVSCSYSLASSSASVGSVGGPGQISVNASDASCAWTATTPDGWITIGPPVGGTGPGIQAITVAANGSTASRSGTVNIQGQIFTVNQAGLNCTFALSSSSGSAPYTGISDLSVNVTAQPGCTWSAVPGPGWIQVTSGSPGNGNGTVKMNVASNASTQDRAGSVLIAGLNYQVTQAGVPCSFSLSATNPVQPAVGPGGGSVGITATGPACPWVASSNAAWLMPSATSGTGNGTVNFTVLTNGDLTARSATLTVAGQNMVVNQSGQTCSYSLRSPNATAPYMGGPNSVEILTAGICSWTASSNDGSWLTINPGSASGFGTAAIAFTVGANGASIGRTGTLNIQGQMFSVTQAGQPCTVTLIPSGATVGWGGASGSFGYHTSATLCSLEVASYSSWVTVTSHTYAGQDGTVGFSAATNTTGSQRTAKIMVGDQTFTVTQDPSPCTYTLTSYAATFDRFGTPLATVPFTADYPACIPTVWVVPATGIVTLGGLDKAGTIFTQNYSVLAWQSFINYVRTAQILVNGQIFTVKQTSW